jgi:hypothetical protein
MLSQKTNLIFSIIFSLNLSINLMGMEITYTPKSLIADPVQYLNTINTSWDMFREETYMLEATHQHDLANLTQKYKELIRKHEQICPLFFLNECTKEEGNIQLNNNCLLSRTYKPHFRKMFEEYTSHLLIEKIQTSPTTPVIYTGFGCGGAFQDLMIITKALMQQPQALLTIHLIDGETMPYVSAVNFLGYSREIKIDQIFNFGSRLTEYEQHARNKEKHDPEIQRMSHQQLEQELTLLCTDKEAKYKQFLSWFMRKFPLSHVSLYIHDHIFNYYDFIEKNNLAHADVVTTADIDDDESLKYESINHYANICLKTLNAKPTAKTAWLKKIDNDNVAILKSLLPKTKNATKIYFDGIQLPDHNIITL